MSKRILVIDDREELLTLLRMLLEDASYRVSVSQDGAEIAATARSEGNVGADRSDSPDLVVLDLRLGGVSGLDVLESLRGSKTTAEIPVIVATAAVTEADVVENLIATDPGRYANVSVLKKPFDGDALLERIELMIGVSEAS
ncbi:MAG TPA: response regulator [Ktedonobacterales bacterium]|jgi:DNA-binding response OmpR family regulator